MDAIQSKNTKSQTNKRIKQEITQLSLNPIPNSYFELIEKENLFLQEVIIYGYDDTPYGGGRFLIEFKFPTNYPISPPEIFFRTKIYHLNVNDDGKINNPLFNQEDWSLAMTLSQMIHIIHAMLADPITDESCIAPHVEEVYFSDKKKYREIAAEWTRKYAFD